MSNRDVRNVMTHVVAGYPSLDDCLKLIVGMSEAGVSRIEVQIPFSDPSADGPTIMMANDVALKNGMTVASSFELIRNARDAGVAIPMYVMTYVNKVLHTGIEAFCDHAKKSGVNGFIIPDLALGTPEYRSFVAACSARELILVPVVSPGMAPGRLEEYLSGPQDLVYVTTTHGITGNDLRLDTQLLGTIDHIRTVRPTQQIALGFGIRTPDDVTQALQLADVAVVGSAVIDAGGINDSLQLVAKLVGRKGVEK